MKHIIRLLFAMTLLFAVPTSMNSQTQRGKTNTGKVTTRSKTTNVKSTTKAKATTTSKKKVADNRPFAVVKPLAEKGDVKAQFRLGRCYLSGEGVTSDSEQAVYWFRKAADKGYADAQFALGLCYCSGVGVAKNIEQTVYWFRKAAERGHGKAQLELGKMYYKGEIIEKDQEQGVYWLKKASAQGFIDGYAKLILEYEDFMESLGSKTIIITKDEPEAPKQSASSSSEQAKSSSSSSSEQAKPSPSTSSEPVYDVVDQMPSFPGGQSALFQFLSQNIHYPVVCEENGIQGRVVCNFIVEADGSISDVQVKKTVDPSLDREAVRLVKSMPKWIPGKDKSKPVRVRYTVPITFRLQ